VTSRRSFLRLVGLAAAAAPVAALGLPEVADAPAVSSPGESLVGQTMPIDQHAYYGISGDTIRINSVGTVEIGNYSRYATLSDALAEARPHSTIYVAPLGSTRRDPTSGTPTTLRDLMDAHA